MVSVLRRGVVICMTALCMGLFVNAVSPHGLPLTGAVPVQDWGDVERIDLARAWKLFQQGNGMFVDARSEEEYNAGHIPGAMLLSSEMFDANIGSILSLIPLDTLIVTYCSGAACGSSREVAELLKEEGYRNVKVYYGGWEDWVKAGYPVEGIGAKRRAITAGPFDDEG